MSKAVFNLQIPISKKLESELRQCADIDDRKLRAYCRRILEFHIEDMRNKGMLDNIQYTSNESDLSKDVVESEDKQVDNISFEEDKIAISLIDRDEPIKKVNTTTGWKR